MTLPTFKYKIPGTLPWGQDVKSFLAPKDDDHAIKTAILMLCLTSPGERVMRPGFGAGLMQLVMEPNDEELAATIEARIQDAVRLWDDRYTVTRVNVNSTENKVNVQVFYQYALSKDPTVPESILEFQLP